MSTGLLASTVTPGRIAPVASLTMPTIPLCARAVPGTNTIAISRAAFQSAFMLFSRVQRTCDSVVLPAVDRPADVFRSEPGVADAGDVRLEVRRYLRRYQTNRSPP